MAYRGVEVHRHTGMIKVMTFEYDTKEEAAKDLAELVWDYYDNLSQDNILAQGGKLYEPSAWSLSIDDDGNVITTIMGLPVLDVAHPQEGYDIALDDWVYRVVPVEGNN